MFKVNTIFFMLVFLILFSVGGFCYSVGATPLISNFGTISKGESFTGNIFISTDSVNPIVLNVGYINPLYDIFLEEATAKRFNYNAFDISFEKVSSWLEMKEKITFSSSSGVSIAVPKQYNLKPNAYIPIKVSVPHNAEPGIHVFSININSGFEKRIGKPTLNLVAITRPSVIFRVPGRVSIEGEVVKISGQRKGGKSADIYYYIKNTGTITVPFIVKSVRIYDEYDDIIFEDENGGSYTLSPGKTKRKTVMWNSREEIKDGKYKVKILVEARNKKIFKTGFVIITSDISPTAKAITDSDNILSKNVSAKSCSIYWFWILFISALITLIYYSRETYVQKKELFRIFTISFIAFFILNYLYCLLVFF